MLKLILTYVAKTLPRLKHFREQMRLFTLPLATLSRACRSKPCQASGVKRANKQSYTAAIPENAVMPDVMQRLTKYTARWRSTPMAAGPDGTSSPHADIARARRTHRRTHPRRARCGLSLFEALLVILIAVPMAQQGVRLAEDYIRQQAGVQESRLLTQVVTAASTLALRDLNARITTRGVGHIEVLALDDLADQDAWVSRNARTALGRDVQVVFYGTGFGELVVLARAVTPPGEETPSYTPRGGIGIGLVGTIREEAPALLRGPGLEYDLSALQAQATTQYGSSLPVVGDHLALTVLRMDQDVLPFLHRVAVDGHPELNRMQTDLDMGGFDLVGVSDLQADLITVRNAIEISELRGTLEVEGNIVAGGNLTIPGTLSSAAAGIDGNIEVRGDLRVNGSVFVDAVEAAAVLSTHTTHVGSITVDGDVSARTLAAGTLFATGITADDATIGTLQAERVTSSGKLEAETIVVTEELLVTGGCTGCP